MALAVGYSPRENEDPLPAVRRSDSGRAEQTPLRIEPEVVQVCEDSDKSSSNKPRHVLQEDDPRSRLANEPGALEPEAGARSLSEPRSLSGKRDVLAGEPRSEAIHRAAPRPSVEGGEVRPDRSLLEAAVSHTRRQ